MRKKYYQRYILGVEAFDHVVCRVMVDGNHWLGSRDVASKLSIENFSVGMQQIGDSGTSEFISKVVRSHTFELKEI